MAKQKGRSLLIKIGDGATTEVFTTLCGLTTRSMTINNSEIDVTTHDPITPDGTFWTEVLDGVKRISVSGTAFFRGDVNERRANTIAMTAPSMANLQIVVPSLGTFAGVFFMQSLEWAGEVEGGVTYSMSLASNGVVTFT